MPKKTLKNFGAGGYWNVIDEKPDLSVEKQTTPFSCVAAVGVMLLKSRGISIEKQTTPFSCVAAVGVMLLKSRGISMTQERDN